MTTLPTMPLADWRESKETLHRFLQMVGKIRLASSARRNHWWNVPYHVTGRGLTTRPMGVRDGNPIFTIDFDFVVHELQVAVVDGRVVRFPLVGRSVAALHAVLHRTLNELGIHVDIAHDAPFDLPDASRPFADDTEHSTYDPVWVTRYWQVLSWVNLVLEEFSARFAGKISPVHVFWHTMDVAVTRFGERVVDHPIQVDPVSREAYSREVVSAGFWFGDESTPHPAFYSYTSPEPDGLADQPLRPDGAHWLPRNGSHLAVLGYEQVRLADDARAAALAFYESTYRAGAGLAGWDLDRYACRDGITDPCLNPAGT